MKLSFLSIVLALASICSAATFESLGKPCRGFNVLATRVIKAPDGKEYFVLSNSNETTGVELIFIDFAANTAKKFVAPAGQGAWLLNPVPGDRLVVGTYYDGNLMIFDLKKMEFVKAMRFEKEEYFWNGAIGGDGRLYGGTYPGAKLAALDLNTYAIEDCGAPAAPNLYCRNVSATPDGRLLCNFVTEKQVTKLYDPKTKKWSDVPAALKNVQRAVVWNGYLLAASGWDGEKPKGPVAFRGENFEPVDPPPFATPSGKEWNVDLFMTTPRALFIRQGTAIWRFDDAVGATPASPSSTSTDGVAGVGPAEKGKLTKIFDQDLKSGAITAIASDGTLLGVRGQDYLVARKGETTAKLLPIPVEASPRPMHWIRADNDGRLWAGPQFGQTILSVDLASGKASNTGIVCNAGGEVYDAAFKDGKVYLVSYVGGDIVEYDPRAPWQQMEGKNPRTIAHLTTKGYIRPVGGVVLGPDGKLYSGWMAKYGSYGGAIAITDTKSGETKLIENPLGEQAINGLAVNGDLIYAATSLHGNGLPEKPNEKPQFGVIERATGKVLYQQPLAGEASKMIFDAKTNRAIVLSGGHLLFFDAKERKFVDPPAPGKDLPAVRDLALDGLGDGRIWFGSGSSVIALDLMSGAIKKFEAPASVDKLSVAKDGAVFVASGPELFRMKPQEAK